MKCKSSFKENALFENAQSIYRVRTDGFSFYIVILLVLERFEMLISDMD